MRSEQTPCERALAALSTLPVSELARQTDVSAHIASCPDCSRVAQVVVERERSLGDALDSLAPSASPAVISETAILAGDRKAIGRFATWVLFAIGFVALWFFLDDTLGTRERAALAQGRLETIEFTCLTPQQAQGLIAPYIRSNGHGIYTTPDGIRGLTIRATPREIASARDLIRKFDMEMRVETHGACPVVPSVVPKP